MTVFVQIFNQQFAKKVGDQKSRMKLSFSPYFTGKLNVTPAKFDVKSVSRELRAINKKYNLANCDLLFFPLVDASHWTVTSVNLLFKSINYFDSQQVVETAKKYRSTVKIVTNFHKACIETNILSHDMDCFEHISPDDLPQQDNGNDCCVYVMMYMENWDGQEFKIFSPQVLPQYRMLISHRLSSASSNDMTTAVEGSKKRRLI